MIRLMKQVVRKAKLGEVDQDAEDLAYWRSRPPAERIAAVFKLRRMIYGPESRLQRHVALSQRTANKKASGRPKDLGDIDGLA